MLVPRSMFTLIGSQTTCLACGVGFVETSISLVLRSNLKDQNKPVEIKNNITLGYVLGVRPTYGFRISTPYNDSPTYRR